MNLSYRSAKQQLWGLGHVCILSGPQLQICKINEGLENLICKVPFIFISSMIPEEIANQFCPSLVHPFQNKTKQNKENN